ncbi:MAG TPA: cytochrome P450 [Ktedonobacteraceae bacterium]|nr:cytochrome P450 [Ktedonobacteraceae bacterium]
MTQVQQSHTIPRTRELPLIGSVIALNKDRLGFLAHMASLGKVSGFHMGPFNVVVFNDPHFIHSFLVDHADDFDKGWSMHRAFVGNGLFISEGAFHAKQRKIVAPSFQPRQVASYADIMAMYGEKLAESWRDGEQIALGKAMNAVTMSIIGKTLFDEDMFSEADDLGKALLVVFNHAAYMVTSPFSLPGDWPTPRNREKDRAWETIRGRLQVMIDARRAHSVERNDFLSLLMNARDEDGQPMDDVQLMDEASTLFSGGQETVANALVWTWWLLAQHPDIYQAMQEEVDCVLQGHSPTLNDLQQLPLCLQVFKESMRLYPSAPVVIRQALRDCVITSDQNREEQYFLKKGTVAMASIYAIHHLASLYPDPESFDPVRHFAPESEKRLPRYGFVPFGAGPRICIGNHFAMMEGHMLVATLAQRVTLELLPGQNIVPSSKTLTTRPATEIRMIVHHR